MQSTLLLHQLEIEPRESPASRHLAEARRARAAARRASAAGRRARVREIVRAAIPSRGPGTVPRPCGC